ncbi:hypothetical protein AAY473_026946 [Plecturocebus cupreus]
MGHHSWLIFVFLVEMGFHHVGQAGLELLTSNDPPAFASQSAGITDPDVDITSGRQQDQCLPRTASPQPSSYEASQRDELQHLLIHETTGSRDKGGLLSIISCFLDPPCHLDASARECARGTRKELEAKKAEGITVSLCHPGWSAMVVGPEDLFNPSSVAVSGSGKELPSGGEGEMDFHRVGQVNQAGLELLTSGDPPALASKTWLLCDLRPPTTIDLLWALIFPIGGWDHFSFLAFLQDECED